MKIIRIIISLCIGIPTLCLEATLKFISLIICFIILLILLPFDKIFESFATSNIINYCCSWDLNNRNYEWIITTVILNKINLILNIFKRY